MVAKIQTISPIAVGDLYKELQRLQKAVDDLEAQKERIRSMLKGYAKEYDDANKDEEGKFVFKVDGLLDEAGKPLNKDLSVSWKRQNRFKKDLFLMEHTESDYAKYCTYNDNPTLTVKLVKKG